MIIVWNCRGCASNLFIAICKDIVARHKPLILILVVTWISGACTELAIKRLGFKFAFKEEAVGFRGGIWILWNNSDIRISPLLQDHQFIHAKLEMKNFTGLITAIYGSP